MLQEFRWSVKVKENTGFNMEWKWYLEWNYFSKSISNYCNIQNRKYLFYDVWNDSKKTFNKLQRSVDDIKNLGFGKSKNNWKVRRLSGFLIDSYLSEKWGEKKKSLTIKKGLEPAEKEPFGASMSKLI